ncbi:MAG: Gfo/Idh/MocA family oxidoreductase [Planctomycetes bacterium]|nr:Gfo/Idh/MocA family oxidoreductase [Planctomycetota bacterium]
MPSKASISRRTFLGASAAAGGAALALPAASAAQVNGANERINVGLIGTGGRCRHLMPALARVPNVRITALCDVYEPNMDLARKLADPKAFTTRNYHEILKRKDIDAVLIASPDHWHVPMTVDACAAGKDVYVEKPLTHKLSEGRTVIEAQNKHKRIVQVGTQQRSMPHFIRGKELLRDGRIGRVHKVHLTWNRNSDRVRRGQVNVDVKKLDWKGFLGNATQQDFDGYRFRNWRWFWDFGNGILTDLMVHFIDVAHWYLDLDHPIKAVTIGDNYTSRGIWQTPDTIQTLLVYPNDIQVYFEGTFCNARNGAMIEFMGTEATMYLDRGRMEIIPEARGKAKAEEMILGKGPRGRDFYDRPDGEQLHLANWIDSIRTRRTPSCPAEAGVSAAAAAHLGNQAFRRNQVAVWAK